jgi:hypothetical protein
MDITPIEKAKELYDKIHFVLPSYHDEGQQEHQAAKECALIAVNELLKFEKQIVNELDFKVEYFYWQQVKTEIEKI